MLQWIVGGVVAGLTEFRVVGVRLLYNMYITPDTCNSTLSAVKSHGP